MTARRMELMESAMLPNTDSSSTALLVEVLAAVVDLAIVVCPMLVVGKSHD